LNWALSFWLETDGKLQNWTALYCSGVGLVLSMR